MYSFAHREDCRVIDEPFYGYYLHRTGKDHPGRKEVLSSMAIDPEEILTDVVFGDYSNAELFIKNMPHHLVGIEVERFHGFQTIFLVRHPSLMIASFSKVIPDLSLEDLAIEDQFKLYRSMRSNGENPYVVDASAFLQNPKSSLHALCERLDIPYQSGMLHWSPGPIKQDGVWAKYWYGSVHQSSGFVPKEERPVDIPPRYQHIYKPALELYHAMSAQQ